MADMNQVFRVVRRKLIDRAAGSGLFPGGVRGYEAGQAPARSDKIHGFVVLAPGGRIAGATLSHVHVFQPFTVHIMRALPLGSGTDTESEQVDPGLSDAMFTLLSVLYQPVTYGDGIEIDPAGHATGQPNSWDAAYLDWDGTKYRTLALTVGFKAHNALETTR